MEVFVFGVAQLAAVVFVLAGPDVEEGGVGVDRPKVGAEDEEERHDRS